jgi:long-subunit fatty acid transport protein
VIALAMLSGFAFASDNQSANYVRMLSRETATDAIDIAYNNPAGTAFLEPGFHVQANSQTIYLNYSHTSVVTSTEYASKKWIPIVPTGYFGYNGGDWAGFFSFTIPEGGGSVDFKDGSMLAEAFSAGAGGSIAGSSSFFAFSLGGAYKVMDNLSVSLHGTMLYGVETYDIALLIPGGNAETKATGIGFGGTVGVNYMPVDGLSFAVSVESGQKIEMTYDSVTAGAGIAPSLAAFGIAEGNKYDADRPWRIRTGLAYEFPFGLVVPVSFKYDFFKAMDDNYRNSWSTSMALRYWISDAFEVSVGGSYDVDEVESVDDYGPFDTFNPPLASFTIAGGFSWEVIDNMKVDLGVLYPIYFEEEGPTTFADTGPFQASDMNKQVINVAIGVGYQF